MICIHSVTVFDGNTLKENCRVYFDENKIHSVEENSSLNSNSIHKEIHGQGNLLVPGFIDIQVNGGGGVQFNEKTSVAALKTMAQTHAQFGTTSLLPTLISDSFEKMKDGLQAVAEAQKEGIPGILGIHLEGPYLNIEKKGIHDEHFIRPPSSKEINEICQFPLDIKLLTLAPEMVPKNLLKQLYNDNVIIFAGHTNAKFEEMTEAFSLGVCGITHFFNACSPFVSRAPGVVGAGLWHDDIWCGLIVDGMHVKYESIRIALKTKSSEHFFLVSDAMAPVGTNLKEFYLGKKKISIHQNRYEDDNGTLAGSSLTMHQALLNMLNNKCTSLERAIAMSSTNPAKCLQLEKRKGKICSGYDSDMVLLNKNNFHVLKVIQGGRELN